MTFRPIKDTFEESMASAVVIKSLEELRGHIGKLYSTKVKSLRFKNAGFDPRMGAYMETVTANMEGYPLGLPVGWVCGLNFI